MTETEQVEFLLAIGKRLDRWTSPGSPEDYLAPGVPLWDDRTKRAVRAPARVIDVLLYQWIRIKDFLTQQPVRFALNPAQRDFSARRTGRDVIAKAGRGGFTTCLAHCGLLKSVTRRGYTSLLVAHDKEFAADYFSQVHFAFDHLPGFAEFRTGALRTTGQGAKKNTREIYFPVLNSRFFIETAGEFAPAEGQSLQYLLCDEMARWKKGDPKQVVATLLSHVTGKNTEVYMFSRPFGDTGEFADRYQAAKSGTSEYRAHFYPWWWNPAQRKSVSAGFTQSETDREVAARYRHWRENEAPSDCGLPAEISPEQLAWRRSAESELLDLFGQEFAEDDVSCFKGSGNCPFDANAIAKALEDTTPVLERTSGAGESENGLLIWKLPAPGRRYIGFLDVAGTLNLSRAAFQFIDEESGEQCAEYVGRIDPYAFGVLAGETGHRYNDALLAVETNLGDISVTVLRALEHYPRLYWHIAAGEQAHLGWRTDPHNRPMMLQRFGTTLRDHPELFHSRRLMAEAKTCERNGDRIQAKKGKTDDLVMAHAGALAVRAEGPALTEPHIEVMHFGEERERGWRILG